MSPVVFFFCRNPLAQIQRVIYAIVALLALSPALSLSVSADPHSQRTRLANRAQIKFVQNRLSRAYQPANLDRTNTRVFQLDDAIGKALRRNSVANGALLYRRFYGAVVIELRWNCVASRRGHLARCRRIARSLRRDGWRCFSHQRRILSCKVRTRTKRRVYRRYSH